MDTPTSQRRPRRESPLSQHNDVPVVRAQAVQPSAKGSSLRCLSPEQVRMIDAALADLGDYGELHLVVEKGRLRFLVVQKSIDVLK